jgi:peroxiredoxin Q/BCP
MFTLTVAPDAPAVTSSLTKLLKLHTYTLLYFYPKDNTPGCTLEGQAFSAQREAFYDIGIGIYGVSKDSHTSHCAFQKKQDIHIPLISDQDLILHKQFEAWGEKTNYWKTTMGTIRSTIILDKKWQILHQRRNVKVAWHADIVLKWALTHCTK